MGSKNRIAKYILPIILADRQPSQWYVEPFVGGANIIDKVIGLRMGSDSNPYLIALLKEMQNDNFALPFIGEVEYKNIQNNKSAYPEWLVGYAGFQLSFGAKFFGGYRRDSKGVRNYENEAQQNLLAQQKYIKGVVFNCCSYLDLVIPSGSIVYCDPPYSNTTPYKAKFDSAEFYEWCRSKSREGHTVFVSEYTSPDDFIEVWHKEVNSSLTVDSNGKRSVERLYRVP